MVIKRFSNLLGSRHGANPFSRNRSSDSNVEDPSLVHGEDTPEGIAARGVRLFCESGGPNNQGEEVLHLPTIVDAAESSPAAAQVAAQQIRRFLSKENYSRPHVQYNAVMLIRILSDNPGATFTRNLNQKFTSTVKGLLRTGKDGSVQQILRETLQALYLEKAYDTNLSTLFTMWSKESGMNYSQATRTGGRGQNSYQGQGSNLQQQRSDSHGSRSQPAALPPPVELAARIEEAKTSAKLLQQLVQSTPPNELQDNDLVKEFAERCMNAQRSMQSFMNSTNPPPDDDTMQTLIETSEQLSLAASKHQRAILQARRSGHTASPQAQDGYNPPNVPPPVPNTGYSSAGAAPASTFTPNATHNLQSYSPPPVPAPTSSIRENLERRTSGTYTGSSLASHPPSLKPSGPPPMAPSQPPQLPPLPTRHDQTSDDPFADNNAAYNPPRGPPPPRPADPVSPSTYSEDDDPYRAPSTYPSGTASNVATLSMRPPVPRGGESWRDNNPGPDQSYHPGYQSTPSYMQRQESSGDHMTMHGAGATPATIDEERVTRSAGRYGRVSPVVERDSARPQSQGNVSPVDNRFHGNPAGANYRY